jgi:hypothetical protein
MEEALRSKGTLDCAEEMRWFLTAITTTITPRMAAKRFARVLNFSPLSLPVRKRTAVNHPLIVHS